MAENQCIELLKNGVYAKHSLIRTEDSNTDYKKYFASDEFRSDFLNKKYNADIEVVIYGVPIKLGYDSDETELNEFQKKVRESTEFKLSSNFFLSIADSFADKNLLEAFNTCNIQYNQLGFNIEFDTTESEIIFKVKYVNFGGLKKPILESVYFTGGKLPVNRTLNDKGEMDVNAVYTFTYEIDENIKQGIFTIDTDVSPHSLTVNFRKKGFGNDSTPLGTVISSMLDWEKFQIATESNKESGGTWKSESSYWSPCDGRKVPDSAFEDLTSQTNVPDLRGVFLRGLNVFDPYGEMGIIPKVLPARKDVVDGRTVGSFQEDELKSHSHTTSLYGSTGGGVNFADPIKIASTDQGLRYSNANTVNAFGGIETRPKNVSIYYYIKIN